MKNSNIRFITRTALILAVVVAIQMIGRTLPYNNFIVGPLVNACLLIATAMLGLGGGLIISILSPFTSLINNHAPVAAALMMFAPVIAAGNFIFILSYYFVRKWNGIGGVILGAVLKFGFLLAGIRIFLKVVSFPKFEKALLTLFSVPQLITALVGGALAIAVIKALQKNMEMHIKD
ncbi:MAG: ECF transporter S component [Clostridia bacterium]|nr:ECF transporter S component [Clostridia bacterium]